MTLNKNISFRLGKTDLAVQNTANDEMKKVMLSSKLYIESYLLMICRQKLITNVLYRSRNES
jgi:hypothetical protein